MEGINDLQLFIISALFLVVMPGPDFVYVLSRGMAEGNKAGVISALGISVGLLVHTILAALGLSAIIQASSIAYMLIKYCGAAYLVYIGVKTCMSKMEKMAIRKKDFGFSNRSIFQQGVLTNVFNPKAIVIFLAFLPQFVEVHVANPKGPFLVLGVILSAIAITWFSVVGYFAGVFGTLIKSNNKIRNGIRYMSGSLLILLGITTALKAD